MREEFKNNKEHRLRYLFTGIADISTGVVAGSSPTITTGASKSTSLSPTKTPKKIGPFGPTELLYKLPQICLARQDSIDDMKEAEDYVRKESYVREEKLKKEKLKVEEQHRMSKEKEKSAAAAKEMMANRRLEQEAAQASKEKGVGG